jgi:hypothetical protein
MLQQKYASISAGSAANVISLMKSHSTARQVRREQGEPHTTPAQAFDENRRGCGFQASRLSEVVAERPFMAAEARDWMAGMRARTSAHQTLGGRYRSFWR